MRGGDAGSTLHLLLPTYRWILRALCAAHASFKCQSADSLGAEPGHVSTEAAPNVTKGGRSRLALASILIEKTLGGRLSRDKAFSKAPPASAQRPQKATQHRRSDAPFRPVARKMRHLDRSSRFCTHFWLRARARRAFFLMLVYDYVPAQMQQSMYTADGAPANHHKDCILAFPWHWP